MRRAVAWIAMCGLTLGACRKGAARGEGSARNLPKGDAVWLADPSAGGDANLEAELQRIGASALFLPAGELVFEGARWAFHADPPPPHPFARIPVVLTLRAGAELSAALTDRSRLDVDGLAHAVQTGLPPGGAAGGPYGRVAGVHLDFPVSAATAPGCAAIATALRRFLPPEEFVSISLRAAPPSERERKSLEPLLESVDALVAFVFGSEGRADPAATDSLQRPWWAAYSAAARGSLAGSDGVLRRAVPEKTLESLSGDPRVELENDLSVNDQTISAFHFVAREGFRVDELSLEAGDRVTFRQPVLPEMIYQLGSTMAGKRHTLGRLIVFDGASDAERVFPLTAFEDVLLGRTLAPVLESSAQPLGHNAVGVAAENRARHASVVSRTANWVEVDVAPAHPADVFLGGFDRYAVYDGNGEAVTPGRATRVRLFETLVMPMEVILPARIVVRGTLPKDCCRRRLHLIAAAGAEVASDWTSPPPTPTPARPQPREPRKRPRR